MYEGCNPGRFRGSGKNKQVYEIALALSHHRIAICAAQEAWQDIASPTPEMLGYHFTSGAGVSSMGTMKT
jgi:hypothetical protein